MTHHSTDKPIHNNPTSPLSNPGPIQDRNDIVRKTSFSLPSLSGFEQISLPSTQEKQNREEETTPPTSPPTIEQTTPPSDFSSNAQTAPLQPLSSLPTTDQHQTVPARPLKKPAQPPVFPSSNRRAIDRTTPSMKRIRLRTFTPTLLLCLAFFGVCISLYSLTTSQGNNSTHSNGSPPQHQQSNSTPTATRSFPVGPYPSLMIKNYSGNVSISADTSNTIIVKTNDNGKTLSSTPNDGAIQFTRSLDRQGHDIVNLATQPAHRNISYDVRVPSTTQVNIEADSGSISIYGILGTNITIRNGNIVIDKVNGPVKASIESGNVVIRNIKGQMTLTVNSGSIQASNINGQLKAITQHGDIRLRQSILHNQSHLKTTDGSLYFTGTIDSTGIYTWETLHGNIDLTLPAHTIFQLQTRIGSGSVSNEFENNHNTNPQPLIRINIGNGSFTVKKGA